MVDDLFPAPEILADDYVLPGTEIVEGVRFKKPEREEAEINGTGEKQKEIKNWKLGAALWIKKNPKIAQLYFDYAKEMANAKRRFGIKLVAERVRWDMYFKIGESYKVNNNHTPYIARWIIAKDSSIEKYMRFRKTAY